MDDDLLQGLASAVAAQPQNVALRLHLSEMLLADSQIVDALGHAEIVLELQPSSERAAAMHRQCRDLLAAGAMEPEPGAVDPTLETLLDITRPELTLTDVAGLEDVKAAINRTFLQPLRHQRMREVFGAAVGAGLLLYGPPGCGKTHVARAMAGELGVLLVSVELTDVLHGQTGASEFVLHRIFEYARESAPAVVFLDELDALGFSRDRLPGDSGHRSVVSQLLTELDGIERNNDGVLFVGATNQPWALDTALRRPGRFGHQMFVPPPDRDARLQILIGELRGKPQEALDLPRIAKSTDGWSGADLSHLCSTATSYVMAESIQLGEVIPITDRALRAARSDIRPSTREWFEDARPYVTFGNDNGVYDEVDAYMRRHVKPRRRRG